jgi:predicted nucleic acid-binding protein
LIVLDASVLIAHQDPTDVNHERAVDSLEAHAEVSLSASALTVAEVLVEHVERDDVDSGLRWLRTLGVQEVGFGPDASVRLATLRARTRLKLPDCCVLLAAQDTRADTIATFDDRLGASAQALGLNVA